MSNDDDFESSSGSSSADVEGYKYAQLTVPNFEFDVSSTAEADAANKYSGNSFVRLGSFPDFSLDTTQVTVDGVVTDKRYVKSVADDAPKGFSNSLELAKLVGDATQIAAAEAKGDTALTDDDSGIQRSTHFNGDSCYLLGFADDTRSRLDDAENVTDEKILIDGNPLTTNTQANRQAETQRLLTKGGWWDHSDGNRVTTTSGDKIEVIQGNYKMVILGRQDPTKTAGEIAGNAFITDISGGHLQEQGPSPTPCIKSVEWVKNEDGWTLLQDNGSGNVTTIFKGKQVDYYTGTKKESYIGQDHSTGGVDSDTANNLELISKTWAKRIESYTGSVDNAVPHVISLTYAHEKQDHVIAASVVATTTATSIASTNSASSIASTTVGLIDVISMTGAPLMVTLNACLKTADIKIGNYYAFGTNKTFIHGNSSTFEFGHEVITATASMLYDMETKLTNNIAHVGNTVINLHNDVVGVQGTVANLNEEVITLSGAMVGIADEIGFI